MKSVSAIFEFRTGQPLGRLTPGQRGESLTVDPGKVRDATDVVEGEGVAVGDHRHRRALLDELDRLEVDRLGISLGTLSSVHGDVVDAGVLDDLEEVKRASVVVVVPLLLTMERVESATGGSAKEVNQVEHHAIKKPQGGLSSPSRPPPPLGGISPTEPAQTRTSEPTNRPEVRKEAYLDADAKVRTAPRLGRPDHVGDLGRVVHELGAHTVLTGPALRTAAVDVDAVAVRPYHLGGPAQVQRRRAPELNHQRSIVRVGREIYGASPSARPAPGGREGRVRSSGVFFNHFFLASLVSFLVSPFLHCDEAGVSFIFCCQIDA